MAMNNEFGDWYRVASVTPTAELLGLRWTGVEAASEGLTASQVIELVRLYVLKPVAGYVAPAFLDKAFRDPDPTFPVKGNIEELRVLAGAVLRNVMDTDNAAASATAYGIMSAAIGNRLLGVPVADHVTSARRFLAERGDYVRDAKLNWTKPAAITRERLDEVLPAQNFQQNQFPNLREPLLTTLLEISTKAAGTVTPYVAALTRLVQSQREELNLLWWLQNGFSKELSKPFHDVGIQAAALVLPAELADLTVFVPGPAAIFGMIVSALRQVSAKDAKVSIKSCVNAVTRDWRRKEVEKISQEPVSNLCPVYLAMSKSLETDGDDDWVPAFKKQADMSTDDKFEARDLANQVYSERMFLRALSELKK